MASYPDSIYAPASKSAGQTITAAFFNDPDAEITAIEQGLRQGTAPLNSSGSTVNTLSVSGHSTFGQRPTMPPPHMALVFRDSTYAAGSSAASTLTWLAQSIATNSSIHSTGTNPERLTPQSTGLYRIDLQIATAGVASTEQFIQADIQDSSNSAIGFTKVYYSTFITGHSVQATALKRFDALGGYVYARFVASGNSTVSLSSGVGTTWFALTKL